VAVFKNPGKQFAEVKNLRKVENNPRNLEHFFCSVQLLHKNIRIYVIDDEEVTPECEGLPQQ
jgi:hypothetical protein